MSRKRDGDDAAAGAEEQAARLLGEWDRLSHTHVAGSGGCSCGHGGAMLRLQDFEQDILDHLRAKYGAAGGDGVLQLLRGEAGGIPALLHALADGRYGTCDADGRAALLADLARSIQSFDRLHRGR